MTEQKGHENEIRSLALVGVNIDGEVFDPLAHLLPPFGNIRCFSFVNRMYLDIF
jgi:hypothetical protein